ncbi:unnamed protein product, partial [Heterosigma akashiwo]
AKHIAKSNCTIIAACSVITRIASYLSTEPPDPYRKGSTTWFLHSDWALYLNVFVFALVGVSVGSSLHKKINQQYFNLFLSALLALFGFSMISSSIIDSATT